MAKLPTKRGRPVKVSTELIKAGIVAGLRPCEIAAQARCNIGTIERRIRQERATHGPAWPIEAVVATRAAKSVRAPPAVKDGPISPAQWRAFALAIIRDIATGVEQDPRIAGAQVAAARTILAEFPAAPSPPPVLHRGGLLTKVMDATAGAAEAVATPKPELEPQSDAGSVSPDEGRFLFQQNN